MASIHWFRKGLRLHDNPAFNAACLASTTTNTVYPVFVLDPWFAKPDIVGSNRYSFLLESLQDLDSSLRSMGTRLFILQGKPEEQIPYYVEQWNIKYLTFEKDSEQYAIKRDKCITDILEKRDVKVSSFASHTLHDLELYVKTLNGKPIPYTNGGFIKLFTSLKSSLRQPERTLTSAEIPKHAISQDLLSDKAFNIPSLHEMGYHTTTIITSSASSSSSSSISTTRNQGSDFEVVPVSHKFPGGEKEALRRLHETVTTRASWVNTFQKPETSPNSIEPSTTVLSPYLKFGCLSVLIFYNELQKIYSSHTKNTEPPVSLTGQLLWREFFYFCSTVTPNFDKMVGNPQCKQIPWDGMDSNYNSIYNGITNGGLDTNSISSSSSNSSSSNTSDSNNNANISKSSNKTNNSAQLLEAWKYGRTGYPYIDAIMTQLRLEGWIHHLARHSVACFLTRGDLWISWEAGAKVFDLYLLDSDWALNIANWQWLSCSNFFYQYFRCYSPVVFGKKTDPDGNYIRHYLPKLAKFPTKYIYEPWKAPLSIQQECGCIIGVDYPLPIVDHDVVSKENMSKMKLAYADESNNREDKKDKKSSASSNAAIETSSGNNSSSSSSSAASASKTIATKRKIDSSADTSNISMKKSPKQTTKGSNTTTPLSTIDKYFNKK